MGRYCSWLVDAELRHSGNDVTVVHSSLRHVMSSLLWLCGVAWVTYDEFVVRDVSVEVGVFGDDYYDPVQSGAVENCCLQVVVASSVADWDCWEGRLVLEEHSAELEVARRTVGSRVVGGKEHIVGCERTGNRLQAVVGELIERPGRLLARIQHQSIVARSQRHTAPVSDESKSVGAV